MRAEREDGQIKNVTHVLMTTEDDTSLGCWGIQVLPLSYFIFYNVFAAVDYW